MADGTNSHDYDILLRGGRVFDGSGGESRVADVGVKDGVVVAIAPSLPAGSARKIVECAGLWVTPGFIDLHTHYDAEVEVAPGLSESVRHGVTTVVLGSCSLSLAVGTPDDLADMFCRVEGLPDDIVRKALHRHKPGWSSHRDYLAHLAALPLGANVASFVGHSAVRAHVMGLERSVTPGLAMTPAERSRQAAIVEDALDAGYLGVSVQTLPWDKLGGTRDWRSRPLPSTFAPWSEVRELTRILRERGAVFQGVPNISTKWNVILFLAESIGLWRKPLKTTVVSMMDLVSSPGIHRVIGAVSRFFNRVLDADFRWQALPEVFDLYADGMDLVVFEELGAGAWFLHHDGDDERRSLLDDRAYRKRFRREWTSRFRPRAFHRQLAKANVVACAGDPTLVGKTFTEIARERGDADADDDAVDVFLDLVREHGRALRWFTVMGNHKDASIAEIAAHPDVLIGFSDAGAHLRSMAHYNFPLRLLRHAVRLGFMTPERAVHRCTGEIGAWLGIDAGRLAVGCRADIAVLDPARLDDRVEDVHMQPVLELDGFERLVRRNDDVVRLVLVGGACAVEHGVPTADLGKRRMGTVLKRTTTPDHQPPARRLPTAAPVSR